MPKYDSHFALQWSLLDIESLAQLAVAEPQERTNITKLANFIPTLENRVANSDSKVTKGRDRVEKQK